MTCEKISLSAIDYNDLGDEFFTVLSVELGNTTIKSIITSTNIKTNKSYQITKLVRLTRNIRNPYDGEKVFGHTIWDKALSKDAICDEITSIILESLDNVGMSVDNLDFVVRSTGVVALSKLSDEMGIIIKALSDGCLNAGITPSQMTAPFSLSNMSKHIQKYSFFNNIEFDGTVVGVNSPDGSGIASNEMEGELVTAGIKLASKASLIEYRNPVISIDMGTTLAGQVVDDKLPYANLLCNYVGLAGGIIDVMLRGSKKIDEKESTIDLELNENNTQLNMDDIHKNTIKIHQYIDIMEVPGDVDEFGLVKVDNTTNSRIKLIGSRINDEKKLVDTFIQSIKDYDTQHLQLQIDDICAYLIKRIVDKTRQIIKLPDDITLGVTGRAAITGSKEQLIEKYLSDSVGDIILVEDALALGAVMMARCMNSLGSPLNPMGGRKKGICVMQQRIKLNKKK